MRPERCGIFTISLDVELYWGLRDVVTLDTARSRLLGDRDVVPRLLDLFLRHEVHATWAAVGFLFFEGRDDLLANLPERRPAYRDPRLDPYRGLERLGKDEREDPFHFAPSLLRKVVACPNQEVGTHTFSHYYCLERGQDVECFASDLRAAVTAGERLGVRVESLVFPRNQLNDRYLAVCHDAGIVAYRGNPLSWMYDAEAEQGSLVRRGARLVDNYVNLSRLRPYAPRAPSVTLPVNVPASRFLRPYSRRLRAIQPLQMARLKREMSEAAERGCLYHLWWHPHNFGLDQRENLALAGQILEHYASLRDRYGMESATMGAVARRWSRGAVAA